MHTTKHGNTYTDQEWAEMMKNWEDDVEKANDYVIGLCTIKEAAAKMLRQIAGEQSYKIACHIWEYGTSDIQFTSESNRQIADKVLTWMEEQERRIR